ncbi:unnamed protein product [Euphydryas editha]|uniref:Uncharacterized protein n=1 Tax=Euphydryas editha TaxID=104508 RepID=A0AAU9UU18_EUPED|nr:unnamed protein product [Euphydryas editha]
MANRVVNKKEALLTRKETLLKELQYYEKRIEEARNTKSNSSFFEDDSSDSEQECSIDISPSIIELKLQQSMLKTCLNATQELTSVQVLQSEVNIMVEDPVFEGEPPVTEEGVWRDVIVECRVDLIPFSMSFYAHKPNRLFAPISYRNLQVTAVKAAHEKELANSVLSTVTTPSDAIEVVRSYARAYRSRRSSLARLAEAYADSLYMEPMPEGGYMLKCANLLEVSWTLQNKWSPIAHFHHKMKFDVEYMDESYIKIITQAHRQLSDPTIETDERTLLMAKIIKTCLEAEKPTQELHESFDSENLKEKRQTLEEPEAPIKSKDSETMAPPKYPPKKIKPKGKENVNKDKKRPSEVQNEGNVKRAKLDTNKDDKITNSKNKVSNKVVKGDAKATKSGSETEKVDKNDNTSKGTTNNKPQKESNDHNVKTKKVKSPVDKIDQNHDESDSNNTENKLSKGINDNNAKAKKHAVVDKTNKIDNASKSTTNSKAQKEMNDNNVKTKKVNSPVDKIDQNYDETDSKYTANKLSKGVNDNNAKAKKHTVVDKTNKIDNASKSTTNSKAQKEMNDNNVKTKKVNSPVDKIDQNHDESDSNNTAHKLSKGVNDNNAKAKKHAVVDKTNKIDNASKSTTNSKAQKEMNDNNAKTKKVNSPVDKIDQNYDETDSNNTAHKLSKGVNDNNAKAKKHTVVDKITKNDNLSKIKPIDKVKDAKTSMNNVKNNDLKSTSTTTKDGKTVPDPKKSNNVANSKNDNRKELDNNTIKVKKVATVKNTEIKRTDVENMEKNLKSTDKTKTKPKGTDDVTKNSKATDRETVNPDKHSKNTKNNTDTTKKTLNTNNEKSENQKSDKSKPLNLAERFIKHKITTNKNNNEKQNAKLLKTTSDFKKNKINVIGERRKSKSGVNKIIKKNIKTSKIPQKRLSSESVKKNPLRISPSK